MNIDRAWLERNKASVIGGIFITLALAGLLIWLLSRGGSDGDGSIRDNLGLGDNSLAPIEAHLKVQLHSQTVGETFTDQPRRDIIVEAAQRYYESRKYRPCWLTVHGLASPADSVLALLVNSDAEALEPDNYQASELVMLADSIRSLSGQRTRNGETRSGGHDNKGDILKVPAPLAARFELALTANLMQYTTHLTTGRINPSSLDSTWKFRTQNFDVLTFFKENETDELAPALRGLLPNTAPYRGLKSYLAQLYVQDRQQAWPRIDQALIDSGTVGPEVVTLNRRLYQWGLLDTTQAPISGPSATFGPVTAAAVREFAVQMGQEPRGSATPVIVSMLNKTPRWWVRQIEINMERMRWLGEQAIPQGKSILVNIPSYRLEGYENGEQKLTFKVIVGDDYHSTPVFTGQMQYLVINPDWVITHNIARKEILPLLQRNPAYALKDSIQVLENWKPGAAEVDPLSVNWLQYSEENFPFKLVQRPGDKNPLGRIKFIFPNESSVYLHDTPFKWRFNRTERGMSHGCIRLQRPRELAAWLLEGTRLGREDSISQAIKTGQQRQVNLNPKVPVTITYLTTYTDERGRLQWCPDIYGHDGLHSKALGEKKRRLMSTESLTADLPAANPPAPAAPRSITPSRPSRG